MFIARQSPLLSQILICTNKLFLVILFSFCFSLQQTLHICIHMETFHICMSCYLIHCNCYIVFHGVHLFLSLFLFDSYLSCSPFFILTNNATITLNCVCLPVPMCKCFSRGDTEKVELLRHGVCTFCYLDTIKWAFTVPTTIYTPTSREWSLLFLHTPMFAIN